MKTTAKRMRRSVLGMLTLAPLALAGCGEELSEDQMLLAAQKGDKAGAEVGQSRQESTGQTCLVFKGSSNSGQLYSFKKCGTTGSWVPAKAPDTQTGYEQPMVDGALAYPGWASRNNFPVQSSTSSAFVYTFIANTIPVGDCNACVR